MNEHIRFDDQVVIVTGAGRGIGRAHAHLLASRGAQVVVCDAGVQLDGSGGSPTPATDVVNEITEEGGRAYSYTADLTTSAGATGAVEHTVAEFGRVDAVIHNAGIAGTPHTFDGYPDEELAGQLNINVWAGFWLARAALPSMRDRKYGRFVFTSSNAIFGTPGMLAYVVAKSAIVGLTQTLALEGAADNIRANAIAPFAGTRMTSEVATPEFGEWAARVCPPERVAPVAALLVHDSCPINGELLLSSGGRVARIFRAENHGFVGSIDGPESVAANFDTVMAAEGIEIPASLDESASRLARMLGDETSMRVV